MRIPRIILVLLIVLATIAGARATPSNPDYQWKMNEGSGTIISDASGNITNKTIQGSRYEWTTSGKIGGGLIFGSDTYVDLVSNLGIVGTNSFTFCAWIIKNSSVGAGSTAALLAAATDAGTEYFSAGYRIIDSNKFYMKTQSTDTVNSTGSGVGPNWTRSCYMRNSSGIYIFLNGTKAASTLSASDTITNFNMVLGRYGNFTSADYYLVGALVDEVNIWTKALTDTEISDDYNSGSGTDYRPSNAYFSITASDYYDSSAITTFNASLSRRNDYATFNVSDLIAWYRFDEGAGTTAYDLSGFARHGNNTNASYVSGVIGNYALQFENTTKTSKTVVPKINITGQRDFSFSGWVKINGQGGSRNILSFRYAGLRGIGIQTVNGPRLEFHIRNDTADAGATTTNVMNNTFYFFAGTYNSTSRNASLFLNGVLNLTFLGNPFVNDTIDTTIGGNLVVSGTADWFNGSIDDVRVYNKTLTAEEVSRIYNNSADYYEYGTTNYSTTNGTINTNIIMSQGLLYNASVRGECGDYFCNYSTVSISNLNTSSALRTNHSYWFRSFNASTSPVFELEQQTSTLRVNHSNASFEHYISDVSASFYWNGTSQTVSKYSFQDYTLFNVSFITSQTNANVNVTLLWNYSITRNNGVASETKYANQTKLQQIYTIGIDNCSTNNIRALNFTLINDSNNEIVNGTIAGYFEAYIASAAQYKSFNISWGQSVSPSICINQHTANYTFSAQMQYGAANFNTETYYFNNANLNNVTDLLNLYLTSGSSLVQFTVVDENDDPVPNVYIQVLLYDLTTDSSTVTEILKTSDPSGTAIGNIVLNTERYKFILTYNDEVVLETSDVILTSTSYQFRISVGQDYFINYDTAFHTNCYLGFDNTTKQTSFTFSDSTSQVNTGCLEINFYSGGSNYQLNRSCVSGSAGSVSLTPTNQSRIGTYIGSGSVEIDGHDYPCGNLTSYTTNTRANILGVRGLVYGMFIFITMVMIGIANPAVALVMGMLGLFISWLLGLFYLSAPVLIGLIAVFLVGAWRSGK